MIEGLRVLVNKEELEEEKDKVFADNEVGFEMDGVYGTVRVGAA